ncbi:MAG: dehydrogenase [Nitrospirae bacterium]|nr:dehydrogenase [Nitrospirota bacterium]
MDLIVRNLKIPFERDVTDEYVSAAAQKLNISEKDIQFITILSKSLDISNKDQFYYRMSIAVRTPESFDNSENLPVYTKHLSLPKTSIKLTESPIIIGFGPAGMFAALELIEYGIKPRIFERGKKIEERSIDVQRFMKLRTLDPESNIQFGEGGAGSYSDGKLFARTKNSYYADRVLDTFIKFGAPEEIRYVGKPHLGTDLLCKIVRNIRNYILERGGEIQYSSRMTDILLSNGMASGVVINGTAEYRSSIIYLALGHSARDTFEMMFRSGVLLEQKPISVGLRVEHPTELINRIRYGEKYMDNPALGNATYSFTYTDRKIRRGVYTFCMCPGGEVINASSEQGMMVVNGMSYSQRSSPFSNSALVVTCHTDDYGSPHPLAGIEFQKDIERRAFEAGGNWKAPAQNLIDFLYKKVSDSLNSNSFKMGATAVNMHGILPKFINETLLAAFNTWKTDYPLFVSEQAILLGTETRTSSPVRIPRGENYESVAVRNLYPIGEGSGYAGGITSSAIDAIKAVEASLSALDDIS